MTLSPDDRLVNRSARIQAFVSPPTVSGIRPDDLHQIARFRVWAGVDEPVFFRPTRDIGVHPWLCFGGAVGGYCIIFRP